MEKGRKTFRESGKKNQILTNYSRFFLAYFRKSVYNESKKILQGRYTYAYRYYYGRFERNGA